MSIKKSYAVLGLGRYGHSVACALADSGAEVLCVDKDENIINSVITEFPLCKCGDVTDHEVLLQLGISNFDTVIIAIAGNLEASVMATVLCREMGVGEIIVKSSDELHKRILEKVGADRVILPEKDSGIRLAKNLISSGFVDMIELSEDFLVTEMDVIADWTGKSLKELSLRKKYSLNVVAIKKDGRVKVDIDPDIPLEQDDKLIIIADKKALNKISVRKK